MSVSVVVEKPVLVRFPDRFQGLFARTEPQFAPLLLSARQVLSTVKVRREFRPFFEYGVLDHAQPSFMLLPLMYLAIADARGGVTQRHSEYLPWAMLAMEACAILDDTVDHTPFRSGRMTYARRFGNESAAPFVTCLVSMIYERTAALEPKLIPLVSEMFTELGALEVWEHESRFPSTDQESLQHWLECRYAEVTPAVRYGLDSALILHDLEGLPRTVSERFAEIFQDVDDLVNLMEHRETDGENDDLKLGMVTHALVAATASVPELRSQLEEYWAPLREDKLVAANTTHPAPTYEDIVRVIETAGVPQTVAKIVSDAEACISATPEAERNIVRDMVQAFVDRLHKVDALGKILDAQLARPHLQSVSR